MNLFEMYDKKDMKYTIELRGNKDEKWRQYGEYDSYLSAWFKDKHEKFWFYLK